MLAKQMRKRACLVVAATVLLSGQIAWAQGYGMGVPGNLRTKPRNNTNSTNSLTGRIQTPFQGSATIQSVGSRGLEVNAEGANWVVAPDKNCKIEVTGTADPSFLVNVRSPLLVRFNAEFDKKGKATA